MIAVTVHVHYLLQRREPFVTAAAGVVITAEALAAIEATLPEGREGEAGD